MKFVSLNVEKDGGFTLLKLTDCSVCEISYLFAYLTNMLDFDDGICLIFLICVLADRLIKCRIAKVF